MSWRSRAPPADPAPKTQAAFHVLKPNRKKWTGQWSSNFLYIVLISFFYGYISFHFSKKELLLTAQELPRVERNKVALLQPEPSSILLASLGKLPKVTTAAEEENWLLYTAVMPFHCCCYSWITSPDNYSSYQSENRKKYLFVPCEGDI